MVMRRRDFIHGLYRIVAAATLCMSLLFVGGYFALHSRTGMNWLAGKIKQATHQQIELVKPSGRLPLQMRADSMVLRDQEGNLLARVTQPSFRCSFNIVHAGLKIMAPELADFVTGTTTTRTLSIRFSAPLIEREHIALHGADLQTILTYGRQHDPLTLRAGLTFEKLLLGDETITLETPLIYTQTNQQGRLDLAGLRMNNAKLSGHVTLDGHDLQAGANLQHPRFDEFNLRAGATARLLFDFLPVGIAPGRGVELQLQASGHLDNSGADLINEPASISGDIAIDLAVARIPRDPVFTGYVVWQDGRLRNLVTGTDLERINLLLEGQDNQLVVRQGEAFDGQQGRITASGEVTFDRGMSPAWTLLAALDRISLFRLIRTELPVSGALRLEGDLAGTGIEGQVQLEASRFIIPRRLPPRIRRLPVVEINHPDPSRNTAPSGSVASSARELANDIFPIVFDITASTRDAFEISGRGLNSTWKGAMHLGGTAAAPALTGMANLNQGYVMLLGRRFQIENGRLDLDGSVPPKPRINVDAVTRIGEVTVRLAITGTTDRPQVRLASDPMLPEEDIMAMILFGKLTDTMTPWQAIALANGLRVITGNEGDITTMLDTGLDFLQVDQLDIRQDEEGTGLASVAVGKHLGRRIYVEGEKGFGEAEDIFKVTLELTPRITLETESSPRIREGVGIYWRRDF
jgi:translocation and assembly module TamB